MLWTRVCESPQGNCGRTEAVTWALFSAQMLLRRVSSRIMGMTLQGIVLSNFEVASLLGGLLVRYLKSKAAITPNLAWKFSRVTGGI